MPSKIPVSISFSTIANYLGTIGVIGSLIFVGLELRQSHIIALAGQIQARNQMASNFIMAPLQGNLVVLNEWGETDGLTQEQIIRNALTRHRALTTTNAWQQYQLGLLSQESWQQAEMRMSQGWNNCENRTLISGQFTASLQSYAAENWSSGECQ
jgi:hypothetical protein